MLYFEGSIHPSIQPFLHRSPETHHEVARGLHMATCSVPQTGFFFLVINMVVALLKQIDDFTDLQGCHQ